MLKEALQYLIGLGNTRIERLGDETFSTTMLHRIPEATAETIAVRSLSGLVEYLQSKFDGDHALMVHVASPTEVIAFDTLNRDKSRSEFIKATAMLPAFRFDNWYDQEDMIIRLQSCFVQNDDRELMLKVVGNIAEEDVKQHGDDGVSQKVVAKTGVATLANVEVPNPVKLKPYRTFVEVEQPESDFVVRLRKGPAIGLFEADGGAWKLEAMANTKEYLKQQLNAEIEAGGIHIIA